MGTLTVAILTFCVTYLLMPLFRKLAFKFNIVDEPGGRKVHNATTPLLGGLAIYICFLIGLLANWDKYSFFMPIFFASTFILVLGIIDDIKQLSAQFRFFVELIVVLALILLNNDIRVSFLPNTPWGNVVEIIVTVFWIVGVTNAYNYLDGLDGLAAGSAVVNLGCFAVILYATGQYVFTSIAVVLIAACAGFLPHNFRKEKIFLGDAGSTFLGFNLACIALIGNWAGDNIVKIFIPVLILGVPIFDMIFTTIMRIKESKIKTLLEWLRYGGKDHFHHYLVDIGLHPVGAVLFIYCITLSLGLSAIMVANDSAIEAYLTLSQGSIIFAIIAVLIVVGKRRRTGWNKEKT